MEVAASGIAIASITLQVLAFSGRVKAFTRSVKDAPQELLRIFNLLDNLNAILCATAELLEQQASLPDHFFPVSSIISRCIQGCEGSMAPLQKIIDKYARSQTPNRLRRLHMEIRTALKAGELQSFEMRLQQEMISLNTALMVNSNNIQLHMYAASMLRGETQSKDPLQTPRMLQATQEDEQLHSLKKHPTTSWSISTSFNAICIYNIRSQRLAQRDSAYKRNRNHRETSLQEEQEFFIRLPFLQYGIYMNRQTHFGPILPALRVYNIVEDFIDCFENRELCFSDNINDFQGAIASGAIHPFTRDRRHRSWLHYAVEWRLPNVYTLLLEYGLKPDNEKYGGVWDSINNVIMTHDLSKSEQRREIDTYRLLWRDYEESYRFLREMETGYARLTHKERWSVEAVWLFETSQVYLSGLELDNFQDALLRGILINFTWDKNFEGIQWLKGVFHTPSGARLRHSLISGDFNLLSAIFSDYRLVKTIDVGTAIISTLLLLDIDIETCMKQQFSPFPLGIVEEKYDQQQRKRVTLINRGGGQFALDWDRIVNESSPGYLLLTELSAFTTESNHDLRYDDFTGKLIGKDMAGPFYVNRQDYLLDRRYPDLWPQRFERRQARKDRKDHSRLSSRLGSRLERTKMPGSWIA